MAAGKDQKTLAKVCCDTPDHQCISPGSSTGVSLSARTACLERALVVYSLLSPATAIVYTDTVAFPKTGWTTRTGICLDTFSSCCAHRARKSIVNTSNSIDKPGYGEGHSLTHRDLTFTRY
ncbi:hypothetical protein BaRGS_00032931 [Batillaria attramentaria]|uniref:Uncharacterized protein n=1 Tax=Batillaria attramentaria TaxID=370345 RepID=A0ABD0JM22_9CAEN